ncbi:hypothetical protein IAD21_02201 [Abditibacteriota bacterium]|nr:hypothetical protein IAD21_02201 [Abditibacteriota bacterium]
MFLLDRCVQSHRLVSVVAEIRAWNGLLFEAFVVDELLPLRPPESVLVLDNALIHQSRSLQEAVE